MFSLTELPNNRLQKNILSLKVSTAELPKPVVMNGTTVKSEGEKRNKKTCRTEVVDLSDNHFVRLIQSVIAFDGYKLIGNRVPGFQCIPLYLNVENDVINSTFDMAFFYKTLK